MQYYNTKHATYRVIFISILILLISFFILIVLASSVSSCIINEVMVNPIGDDAHSEWIELYNPTNVSINLSGYKIVDNYATDELLPANATTPISIPPYSFVVITDQDTSLLLPNDENHSILHFMVDDNSICNGLGNDNDFLILLNENETVIDSVEWGINSGEVPGYPVNTPAEGNSIIRINYLQSNNSTIDFAETTIPTLGKDNVFSKTGSITIDIMQQYLPKIPKHDMYSPPFAIHVSLTNFSPKTSYQLKSFITGNTSNHYPASQTWTQDKWQYSDRYTHPILTDESGCWNDWVYLRFSKNYQAYSTQIQHNHTCKVNVKVKDNITVVETQQDAFLLDFDNSTSNGIKGGFVIGTKQDQQMLYLTNESGGLLSCYPSEPNDIKDFSPVIDGYYKLTGPADSNVTLNTIDSSGKITVLKTNISIPYGCYHFDMQSTQSTFDLKNRKQFSTKITIKNRGNLKDTYYLLISDQSPGFQARLETSEITLEPNQEQEVTLYIDPLSYRLYELYLGSITVTTISKNDPLLQKNFVFSCTIHEPDLIIPKIKTYDHNGIETDSFGEGSIVRVKAFLKNNGSEKATDVTVSYFLDKIHSDSLLYTKTYDTVLQFQKYPSLYWDSHLVSPGKHTIFVVADYHDTVKELDEYNNQNNVTITILNTTPSDIQKKVLITEFYYYAHPTIHNEFVTLYNPTNTSVDLDGWYVTNTVSKRITDQKKIIFPKNNVLPAKSRITLTQNSTAYYQERLMNPDFEYETNANHSIPQLLTTRTIYFSNQGGSIALKDSFNHTIDGISYGNTIINDSFWNGSSIPQTEKGEILKRQKENNSYQDTNTALDWILPRSYQIGQSTFSPDQYNINASITPFISPDTSFSVFSKFFKEADSEILLNVYEFTSYELTNLLINALQQDISLKILAEGSPIGGVSEKQQYLFNRLHYYGAQIHYLKGNQIDHMFKRYRFTHAKYAVIDQKTVIIHSGNYASTGIPSVSSFGNREWGISITNESIAAFYEKVFYDDWNLKRTDTHLFKSDGFFEEHDYFLPKDDFYGRYQPVVNQTQMFNITSLIQPVLSPDNSLLAITNLISKANESIYLQQLYIYPNWTNTQNPLIPLLIDKANQGLDVRIILNYNPWYDSTNVLNNQTKRILETKGIKVKYIYTNWSIFQNVHNKGAIIDNTSVLISSINWNENSFLNNREIGVIITHPKIAQFYSSVFLSDWTLTDPLKNNEANNEKSSLQFVELNANTIYIAALFTMTFIVVARDWRKRSWP